MSTSVLEAENWNAKNRRSYPASSSGVRVRLDKETLTKPAATTARGVSFRTMTRSLNSRANIGVQDCNPEDQRHQNDDQIVLYQTLTIFLNQKHQVKEQR